MIYVAYVMDAFFFAMATWNLSNREKITGETMLKARIANIQIAVGLYFLSTILTVACLFYK